MSVETCAVYSALPRPIHLDPKKHDPRAVRNKGGKSRLGSLRSLSGLTLDVLQPSSGLAACPEWFNVEILLSDCVSFLFINLISSLECVLVCLDGAEYSFCWLPESSRGTLFLWDFILCLFALGRGSLIKEHSHMGARGSSCAAAL